MDSDQWAGGPVNGHQEPEQVGSRCAGTPRGAGTVEIESQWTAFGRGNQLPEGVCFKEGERFGFPTVSTRNRERMEHPQSEAAAE